MHICSCSSALEISKKIWIQTCFGPVAVVSVEVSRPFCVFETRIQTCTFLVAPNNCIFWGASVKLIKNLANLNFQELQGFHGSPLSQFFCPTVSLSIYTLRYAWHSVWERRNRVGNKAWLKFEFPLEWVQLLPPFSTVTLEYLSSEVYVTLCVCESESCVREYRDMSSHVSTCSSSHPPIHLGIHTPRYGCLEYYVWREFTLKVY